MNVMVWYFVSGTHNVIITLILLVLVLVWLEPRENLFGCLKCSVEAFFLLSCNHIDIFALFISF
jgi:hypothetical protein